MILEQETFEAFGYYPKDLTHGSNKLILAACELCGAFRVTTKHHYRFFVWIVRNEMQKAYKRA